MSVRVYVPCTLRRLREVVPAGGTPTGGILSAARMVGRAGGWRTPENPCRR
jgi:hypothetical protein